MKMRKFFHVVAIMFSSLAALISHGKAQETTSKEKKGEGVHHRHHHSDNSDADALSDPPHHSRSHTPDDGDDVKNSSHAVVWKSYAEQEDADAPPPIKLNQALMASAERPLEALVNTSLASEAAPPPLPGDEQSLYPWKRQIVTTTFWIGETPTQNNPTPNSSSCWDPHWAADYGGNDTPDPAQRTADYIPAAFIPGQNPFYVALPYNDMENGTQKPEAAQVIPWFAKEYKGSSQSLCKGHWVAIRFGNRICYAQWEDAGPFRTDHWEYVFGKERPLWNLNGGAGLDVSPAVRDYLGMNSTDVTDWKFVDVEEIPSGPWERYGENNTFVQNARKAGGQVVDVARDLFHDILPARQRTATEVR